MNLQNGVGSAPMHVVAFVNAHALAHVSRVVEVGKVLRERGHHLTVAGGGPYLRFAAVEGFDTRELPYLTGEHIHAVVKSGRMDRLYRDADLAGWVRADQSLLRSLAADVVLVDNRISSPTAAEALGRPCVSLMNVHVSRHRRIPFNSLRHILPAGPASLLDAADRWENAVEHVVYHHLVVSPMNRVRADLGLAPRHGAAMEEGDWTLFPDIPEFNPTTPLPPRTRFIGPITWRAGRSGSRGLERLDPERPTAYLTLGSGGLLRLMDNLSALRRSPIQFVLAVGNDRPLPPAPSNVHLLPYVDVDRLLPQCDAVICHGGNGTLYQALAHGLPVAGFATHAEQSHGLKRIQELGLGLAYHENDLIREGMDLLLRASERVMRDERYRCAAQEFSRYFPRWNGAETAADVVERVGRPAGSPVAAIV
jgi:UDP:flavonoid glycosyltransferase YjiC (YdhE family)